MDSGAGRDYPAQQKCNREKDFSLFSRGWNSTRMRAVKDESLQGLRVFLVGLPRPAKRLVMVLADQVFMLGAAALAIFLTNPVDVIENGLPWILLFLLGASMLLIFTRLGLYRAVVRFLRSRVVTSVMVGVTLIAGLMAAYALARPESV